MSKKDHKISVPQDNALKLAWRKYVVGNFHAARALARSILANAESPASSREQAAQIITMSGIDLWALVSGFLVLLFSGVVAFLVAY